MWTVSLDGINTMDMIQRRRPTMVLNPNWCVLCKNNSKTASHKLLHCEFSKSIWNYFFGRLHQLWVMPATTMEMIHHWNSWGMGFPGRLFWNCVVHGVLWDIWKEIYRWIFNGLSRGQCKVADSILRKYAAGLLSQRNSKTSPLLFFMRNWLL